MTLNLTKIPTAKWSSVKQEIGHFIVNEILLFVGRGESPVAGQRAFKKLSSPYAKAEKRGDRTPNLDLEGDMLDALTFKDTPLGISVGIFDAKQAPKAHGHNTGFDGERPDLRRAFIPDENETFKQSIMAGVNGILNSSRVVIPPPVNSTGQFKDQVIVSDLFANDLITRLLSGKS